MKRQWLAAAAAGALLLAGCGVQPVLTPGTLAPADALVEGAAPLAPPPPPAQALPAPSQPQPKHVDIHGLYMTGWTAGSNRFYELVAYMERSGLNAVVIDVQDDDGMISWESEVPLARAIGAGERKIPDVAERLAFLKAKGIYTIGRVVVYADPLLGKSRPELAIQGGNFIDTRGIRWPDPYNEEVWAYKVAIAKEAATLGFDEIQFDYIRFPEHRIAGYNAGVPVRQRTDAIEGFLRYAKEELAPMGVRTAADLFGLTTSVAEGDDMEIGQDYAAISQIVDYVLPMVYPSHYARGTYGIADPNAEPGRIVYESLVAAQKRVGGIDVQKHRPWIQDFDYGKHYTAADVEAQIRGLARAGIYQWILWNPHNRYTETADYGVGGGFSGPPGDWHAAWAAESAAEEARARAVLEFLGARLE